jgi:hypothetical protein
MNNDFIFFRTLMTGLFIGIVDTIICLGYNIGYRSISGYLPSAFINVSSLIFIVNLLFLVIGILYFGFLKAFGRKDILFVLFMLLVTAFCVWAVQTGHRFDEEKLNQGFRGLLSGIILILGISSVFLPFLYHSKSFERNVL